LQDAKGQFYLWDKEDHDLFRVTEDWITKMELFSTEDIVLHITVNQCIIEEDSIPIYLRDRTYRGW
jgi:hypothetical protein